MRSWRGMPRRTCVRRLFVNMTGIILCRSYRPLCYLDPLGVDHALRRFVEVRLVRLGEAIDAGVYRAGVVVCVVVVVLCHRSSSYQIVSVS